MAKIYDQGLSLLQTALNDSNARFRAGQWSAISAIMQDNFRLLVVQRTGWGKSLVYFIATKLLRDRIIEPRKQWLQKLPNYGFSGNIKPELRAETGKALSLWGDAGWGELVKRGKYKNNHFDDALVQATVEMIQRSSPQPLATWVTCVSSLTRPKLVPNFTQRLADKLGLPFNPIVIKVRQNKPQKEMNNSYQQALNLDGVFKIDQTCFFTCDRNYD